MKSNYIKDIKLNEDYTIIGLKGPKTVGKSTFAETIKTDNSIVLALAAPIKDIVHNVFKYNCIEPSKKIYQPFLDEEHINQMDVLMKKLFDGINAGKYQIEEKESIRYFYQQVGDIMRSYDENIYLKIFLNTAYSQDRKTIICDDIRQFNEAFLCDKLYHLSRGEIQYTNEHVSEKDYTEEEWEIIKQYIEVEDITIKNRP